MQKNCFLKETMTVAGAYMAFIIGSGFATGQEILRFFTFFEKESYGALLISFALFTWAGFVLTKEGREKRFSSNKDIYEYYCGKYIGAFFERLMPVIAFSSFVIMVSGSGAVLKQYYGIGTLAGRCLMVALSFATVCFGLKRISDIIGFMGSGIAFLALVLGVCCLFMKAPAKAVPDISSIARASEYWAVSGVLYMSFQIITLVPFLISLSNTVKSKQAAVLGGALGGALLIISIAVLNEGFLSQLGEIYNKDIPTLYLANKISPVFAALFAFTVLCGIYTTAVPLLWLLGELAAPEKSPRFLAVTALVSIASLFLSALPFPELVSRVYPFTGYIGIVLLAQIAIAKLRK